MEISFTERGEGWRRAGRPSVRVPPELLEALQQTRDNGVQARVPLHGAPDEQVRQVVRLLEHGARQLGGRLRHQVDADVLRFYLDDKGAK